MGALEHIQNRLDSLEGAHRSRVVRGLSGAGHVGRRIRGKLSEPLLTLTDIDFSDEYRRNWVGVLEGTYATMHKCSLCSFEGHVTTKCMYLEALIEEMK